MTLTSHKRESQLEKLKGKGEMNMVKIVEHQNGPLMLDYVPMNKL